MLYTLLMVSMVVLLSVVLPHHHLANGLPCYGCMFAGHVHQDDADTHDCGCGCEGHSLAYLSVQDAVSDVDSHHFLIPLYVLFDYVYPPELELYGQPIDRERAFYIESLHDTWIVNASGLRAPPMS